MREEVREVVMEELLEAVLVAVLEAALEAMLEAMLEVVEVSQSYCGVERTGRWRSVPRPSLSPPPGPSLPWLFR